MEPSPKVKMRPLHQFTPRQAKLNASFLLAKTIPILRDIVIGVPAPTQMQTQMQMQMQMQKAQASRPPQDWRTCLSGQV